MRNCGAATEPRRGPCCSSDSCPGSCGSAQSDLTVVGHFIVLRALTNGVTGRELWKIHGTAGGAVLVKDIFLGITSSNLAQLVDANGVLVYFQALATGGLGGGIELWKSNGTSSGTVQIKDIWSPPRLIGPTSKYLTVGR